MGQRFDNAEKYLRIWLKANLKDTVASHAGGNRITVVETRG